jgi:RNA recognition motif-containing protein
MAKKLFVGNLNYRTTDQQLHDAFAEIGSVESATVITDRETGRSRGFGFVEMGTEDEAQQAIQQLNDTMLDGRTIRVAEANPRQGGRGGSRGGGRGGSRGGGRRY